MRRIGIAPFIVGIIAALACSRSGGNGLLSVDDAQTAAVSGWACSEVTAFVSQSCPEAPASVDGGTPVTTCTAYTTDGTKCELNADRTVKSCKDSSGNAVDTPMKTACKESYRLRLTVANTTDSPVQTVDYIKVTENLLARYAGKAGSESQCSGGSGICCSSPWTIPAKGSTALDLALDHNGSGKVAFGYACGTKDADANAEPIGASSTLSEESWSGKDVEVELGGKLKDGRSFIVTRIVTFK